MGDGILWMKMKMWMTEGLPEFYREIFSAWGIFFNKNCIQSTKERKHFE